MRRTGGRRSVQEFEFQRLVLWLVVPEDLPQIAHVDRLAADGQDMKWCSSRGGGPPSRLPFISGPRSDSLVTLGWLPHFLASR